MAFAGSITLSCTKFINLSSTSSVHIYPNSFTDDLKKLTNTVEVDYQLYPGQIFYGSLEEKKIGIINIFETALLIINDKQSFLLNSYRYDQELDTFKTEAEQFKGKKLNSYIMGGLMDLDKRDEFSANIKKIFDELNIEADIKILPVDSNLNELVIDLSKLTITEILGDN